jgi:hypothetical protein
MTEEAKPSAFELKWWPLDIAIAWVLTRDRTFVERQWKRGGNGPVGITVAVEVEKANGRPLTLEFPGIYEAWTQLKSRLEEGAIKTVGTPFRRVSDSAVAASESSESQREIEEAEIGSLMLHEEGDAFCLIPEDWRVARGSNWHNLCGYRNVQIRPTGVTHYFPPSTDLTLPSENLGPPRSPHLRGWMSISDAAYWIASEGGRVSFDLNDLQKWQAAFYLLLPVMSSGQISVIGRRHGKGLAAPVPPTSFSGVAVDYPYSDSPFDLLCCERPHIQCYGIVDHEHWEKTFYDRLMSEDRHVPEYSHLQVSNSDLAKEFPFPFSLDSPEAIERTIQSSQSRRVQEWRQNRIQRFTDNQRRYAEWINFAEIADWCSKEDGSILPDLQKRQRAFETLANDLLAGDFAENGRSRVLFLHPAAVPKSRLTAADLRNARNADADLNNGHLGYLPFCWIQRAMFDRWLAKHRLPATPSRFEPLLQRASAPLRKPKRGRPAEYNWPGVKERLSQYVSKNGRLQMSDELLQKCADYASELHPQKRTPDDKTIREAIKSHKLDSYATAPLGGK